MIPKVINNSFSEYGLAPPFSSTEQVSGEWECATEISYFAYGSIFKVGYTFILVLLDLLDRRSLCLPDRERLVEAEEDLREKW